MVLATYIALQYTRTPAYAAWLGAFRAQWAAEEVIEALPEPPGAAVSRIEAIGAMLRHAPRFAHVFLRLNWTVWGPESERFSFVTSDSPVCRVWREQPEVNVYAGAGFLSPEVITIFPLTQASALAMSGIGNRYDQRRLASDQVRRVNLAVLDQAQHYVFDRDTALVESLVRRTGGDRRQWQPPFVD